MFLLDLQLGLTGVARASDATRVLAVEEAELAIIRDRVNAINASIREIAGAGGVPVLDLNAFTTDLLTNGREYAGITLNGSFLTGGLVGYDGIHPTETGYVLIVNE